MSDTMKRTMRLSRLIMKQAKMVGAFHDEFQVTSYGATTSLYKMSDRFRLIHEEFNETKEALIQNDDIEAADGFCDLLYVLYGTFHELNWDQFEAFFGEDGESVMFSEHVNNNMGFLLNSLNDVHSKMTKNVALNNYEEFLSDCIMMITLIVSVLCDEDNLYNIPENFEIVHESNMNKVATSVGIANDTIDHYNNKDVHCFIEQNHTTGHYLIKRTSDGKVMKQVNWEPPKIKLNNMENSDERNE